MSTYKQQKLKTHTKCLKNRSRKRTIPSQPWEKHNLVFVDQQSTIKRQSTFNDEDSKIIYELKFRFQQWPIIRPISSHLNDNSIWMISFYNHARLSFLSACNTANTQPTRYSENKTSNIIDFLYNEKTWCRI